ncbi:MAG: M20/M25/M40 family metallo-hydrolase, partial [Candidatus Acidiferrales bacterium]
SRISHRHLFALIRGWEVARIGYVERFNVFATWSDAIVTLSSHMDTVPPFLPSREDNEFLWGRGACDAKGANAATIGAAETLLDEGARGIGQSSHVSARRPPTGARLENAYLRA